jgi:hypothetical protein
VMEIVVEIVVEVGVRLHRAMGAHILIDLM